MRVFNERREPRLQRNTELCIISNFLCRCERRRQAAQESLPEETLFLIKAINPLQSHFTMTKEKQEYAPFKKKKKVLKIWFLPRSGTKCQNLLWTLFLFTSQTEPLSRYRTGKKWFIREKKRRKSTRYGSDRPLTNKTDIFKMVWLWWGIIIKWKQKAPEAERQRFSITSPSLSPSESDVKNSLYGVIRLSLLVFRITVSFYEISLPSFSDRVRERGSLKQRRMTVTAQQLTEKRDHRTGVVLQSLCKSHHAQYKYVINKKN